MRHRFHAICPYFAMFPEIFVEKHLVYSKPDDLIFDPFSGRGTTAFQAILSGRRSIAMDTSPVAYCVSKAKVSPPSREDVFKRIDQLRDAFAPVDDEVKNDPFYELCFERETLDQILFLRSQLNWRKSNTDTFIAAVALGRLHGESHKSSRYFSNQMPRTIATKPNYSVNWWKRSGCTPPKRDAFKILKQEVAYRFETGVPSGRGHVKQGDARNASTIFDDFKGEVSLIITSPPYPDTTHFIEDQWLRVWFLGGKPHPRGIERGDDRHIRLEKYWAFLEESWAGSRELLNQKAPTVVVRIGGSKLDIASAQAGLLKTMQNGFKRKVRLKFAQETLIVGGQLRSFRPSAPGTKREFDFVFEVGK